MLEIPLDLAKQIEARWPHIPFRSIELRYSSLDHSSSYRQGSEQTGFVDLQSLLKASQLLSQEIHLESLLQRMLGGIFVVVYADLFGNLAGREIFVGMRQQESQDFNL